MSAARDRWGRFARGCPAGPGRGRRRPPTEAENVLADAIRGAVNATIETRADVGWADVEGALVRLLARARALKRGGT